MKRLSFGIVFLLLAFLSVAAIQRPTFDAATIKLNKESNTGGAFGFVECHGTDARLLVPRPRPTALGRCVAVRITLKAMIRLIYFRANQSTPMEQLVYGGPSWIDSDLWDIEGAAEKPSETSEATLRSMLETLVVERFKLQFHHETRQVQGFTLSVAKGGPKLQPAAGGAPSMVVGADRTMTGRNLPIQRLVSLLAARTGGQIIDNTGLTGVYDFTLTLTAIDPAANPAADTSGPSIFTEVQEQLGLKLESKKIPVESLVIDHAEKPAD